MNQSTIELAWRLLCEAAMLLEDDPSHIITLWTRGNKKYDRAVAMAEAEFNRKNMHAVPDKSPAEVAWDAAHVLDRRIQQQKVPRGVV